MRKVTLALGEAIISGSLSISLSLRNYYRRREQERSAFALDFKWDSWSATHQPTAKPRKSCGYVWLLFYSILVINGCSSILSQFRENMERKDFPWKWMKILFNFYFFLLLLSSPDENSSLPVLYVKFIILIANNFFFIFKKGIILVLATSPWTSSLSNL